VSGTLTFLPGQVRQTITIPVINNTLDEPEKTFAVTLAGASGATLGTPATATVTIRNDDKAGVVRFRRSAYSVVEGPSGTTRSLAVELLRTWGVASGVTVDVATQDGSATAGEDYTPVSQTVTFEAGQRVATLMVEVLGDAVPEGNESLTLTLVNPGGGAKLATPQSATLWIVD